MPDFSFDIAAGSVYIIYFAREIRQSKMEVAMRNSGLAFLLAIAAGLLLIAAEAVAQQEVVEKKEKAEQQEAPENGGEPGGADADKEQEEQDQNSQVYMQDGSFFKGLIDLEEFTVDTEYGKLVVPRDQVVKIRIGKKANTDLKEKIDTLIEQLGDQEFKVRQEAKAELSRMGPVALQEIKQAARSEDPEVKRSAEELVKEIEAAMPPDAEEIIDDDEIVAMKFTIRGTLLVDEFVITTRYGVMKAPKKDVKAIVVNQPSALAVTVDVSGATNAGDTNMKDSGIDIRKGDRVIITAQGSVFIRSWGINVGPDGDNNYGQHFPPIAAGALMGRIGQNGPLFAIGSSYKFTADRDGRLLLGIAVRDRYQSSGDFKVKIQTEKE
jgi:hypothetical protein